MEKNDFQQRPIVELQTKIGYTFKNKRYLVQALTHSSYSNEVKAKGENIQFNERLEYLGDAVLQLIVSTYFFKTYPENQEGNMSKMRSSVVCERALSKFATQLDLGSYLFMGHGESVSGRTRPSALCDAFEAVIAAIYLDCGETLETASEFVLPFIKAEVAELQKSTGFIDYKTKLQQVVQQAADEHFEYVLTAEDGPAHDRVFTVEARLNSNVIGRGTGKTKRAAEQNAAKEALILFGEDEA